MKWKRAERKVARLLQGKRNPVSAQITLKLPDVDGGRLAVEVKDWDPARLPKWFTNGFTQAEAAARVGQIPVLVIHPHGVRYVESYAVVRLRDLLNLVFGNDAGN